MTTKTRNILLISVSAIAVISIGLYLASKKKYEKLEKTYSKQLEGMTNVEITEEDMD